MPVTAAAYAQALFGSTPTPWGDVRGLGADAATANPLMGADTLEPLIEQAHAAGAGVFALVRTSNVGAQDIEDLDVEGGGTVTDRVAAIVGRLGEPLIGARGISSLGAVVGATAPEHIERLREAMPSSVFLIPGVGAQGGKVADLAGAYNGGRALALVTVSRALVGAGSGTGDQVDAARAASARLRQQIWDVSG